MNHYLATLLFEKGNDKAVGSMVWNLGPDPATALRQASAFLYFTYGFMPPQLPSLNPSEHPAEYPTGVHSVHMLNDGTQALGLLMFRAKGVRIAVEAEGSAVDHHFEKFHQWLKQQMKSAWG